ncbi:MAG: glycosyltransferase family 1 protein [Candidatus Moraniibacteriota bacterium]
MKIGVNASFVRKPDAGMGRVSANFLQKLAEIQNSKFKIQNSGVEFFLYLEEDIDLELPEKFHKRIFLPPYKRDDLIRKIWWEKYLLPKKAKKDGCDVFFSLYQCPTILRNIPHIMLVHDAIWRIFPDYLNNSRKKTYAKKTEKAIQQANKIMTISESSKKDIKKFFQVKDEDVIINPIDCDPGFKKNLTQKELNKTLKKFGLIEEEYIFYVGGFDVRKNVDGLIKAYAILWQKYSEKIDIPDLVIAGGFNPDLIPLVTDLPEEIRKAVKNFGVPQEKFKTPGFVEQNDLPALYRGAKAFCFPSLYEGFGLPVLEAFNSGCSVVVSDNSSLGEIANRKNAFIFKNGNDEDLAEKIYSCLRKEKKRKEKISQAVKTAKQYSWGKFADKFIESLRNVKK